MSDGSKGGWKFTFRDDEVQTLKEVLDYVADTHKQQLGIRSGIDAMAHRVCLARVEEIKAYIEDITG